MTAPIYMRSPTRSRAVATEPSPQEASDLGDSRTLQPVDAAAISRRPATSARTGIDLARAGYNPLGVLRLILAVMVLVQHAATHTAPDWLHRLLVPYELGSMAVYVFFVLSGYIIADAVQLVYAGRPVAFLANRMLRLVPSYVVALALFLVVAGVLSAATGGPVRVDEAIVTREQILSPALWLANLAALLPFVGEKLSGPEMPTLVSVVWAVRIEILFYGVVFALLALSTGLRISFGRLAAGAGVLTMLASIVWFDALAGKALENAPLFVAGVAAHRLINDPRRLDLSGLTAGGLLATALATAVWRLAVRDPVFGPDALTREILAEIAIFLAALALFGWLASLRLDPRSPLAALDRRLGEATYPIYLNHMTVVTAAVALSGSFTTAGFIAIGAGGILFSLLVSWPTEPLIARLRDRVRGRRLA